MSIPVRNCTHHGQPTKRIEVHFCAASPMPSEKRRTGNGPDEANPSGLWWLKLHVMFAWVYPECRRQSEALILGKRLRCYDV